MSRSRSRSSRVGAATENELKRLVSSPENANKCGECRALYPTWSSVNLGVMLCGRCASVHRKLLGFRDEGVYSHVKSLSMDRWSSAEIDDLANSGGNKRNNKVWNAKGIPFPFDADEDKSTVEQFIRDKYIFAKFRYDPVDPHEYGMNGGGYMPEGIRPRSRSRASSSSVGTLSTTDRLRSRSVGGSGYGSPMESTSKLTNRKARDYELSRYSRELRILRDRGYPSIDNNAEALSLAKGDVSRAMAILDRNTPPPSNRNRSGSSIGGYASDDYGRRSNGLAPSPLHSSAIRTASASAVDTLPHSVGQEGITGHLTEPKPNLPRRRAATTGPQPAVFDGTDGTGDLLLASLTGTPAQPQPQPAIFDGTTGMSGTPTGIFDGNTGVSVQQFLDPATGIIYVDQNEMALAQQQQLAQQAQQEQLQQQQQHAQAQAQAQ
ncbi:putative GTPase activating protein for Arf-domain-containing protein, partial [Zygosaccharomyces rouxii]